MSSGAGNDRRRLILATLFALAAGVFVYAADPGDRIKADLRADAKGFVISLEYSAKLLKGLSPPPAARR